MKNDYWISITDIMTGLMLIFLFISFAFMLQAKQQKEFLTDKVSKYEYVKLSIYKDLSIEFKNELTKWNAEIDPQTLSVNFKEPDIFFEAGKSELNSKFKNILNNFFPRYISVLNSKYKDYITEIRIEGHTSNEWNGEVDTDNAYFNNMKLSQDRARNTLEYVYKLNSIKKYRPWMKKIVTANGLSYSRPKETLSKSRRVEFKVVTNSEENLKVMQEMIDQKVIKK